MFIFQFFIFLLQEVGEPGGHTTEYVAKKNLCHTVSYFSHLFFFFGADWVSMSITEN